MIFPLNFNLGKLNYNTIKPPNDRENKFIYTDLHLNIQSLPAKFDNLKILFSELYTNNIEIDFILIYLNHFKISGYSLVYQNRINLRRGGVAIYINSKRNYKPRDDLALNVLGIFESII